jgi:cellulose synthase/poly-beta-1,6-N-acetylglucosamine synthase-like glycosyltransferase
MWQVPIWIIYAVFFMDFFIAFFYLSIYIQSKIKKENLEKKEREITFIIPAYNRESTIKDCVESIRNARYPQNKIKIIIVDDGSKDKTYAIAKELEKKYSNVKVLTKKNEGRKAFPVNFGLKHANTELVAILDGDCFIKEDVLERAMPFFSKKEIMAVVFRMKPTNKDQLIERMQYIEYALATFYRKIIGAINSLPVSNGFSIFRKEFFDKHGYFETDNMTEDFEMGLRIQDSQYNLGYVSESYSLTDVPDTFRGWAKQRLRWSYGTLYNYKKYKHIFLNKKYGDLGIFILPSGFISLLVVSLIFLFALYSAMNWGWNHIQMIQFGWYPSFSLNLNSIYFFMIDLRIILFFFSILVGLTLFSLCQIELKEKLNFIDYALTLTLYMWMLAVMYIISLAYFLIGKRPKW